MIVGLVGLVCLVIGIALCVGVRLSPEHGHGTTGDFGVFACSILTVLFSVFGALLIPLGFSRSAGLGVVRGLCLVTLVVQVIGSAIYSDAISRKKVWRLVITLVIVAALFAV